MFFETFRKKKKQISITRDVNIFEVFDIFDNDELAIIEEKKEKFDWQIIFDFTQTQINDLKSFVDDIIIIKLETTFNKYAQNMKIMMQNIFAKMSFIAMFVTTNKFSFFEIFWNFVIKFIEFDEFNAFERFTFSIFLTNLAFASFASKLRVEKLKYFDSKYQEKSKKNNIFTFVVNASKHVFYKNVFVFIKRLKNLVKQHDDEIVERLVIFCLRDFVLIWYFVEINDFMRILFRDARFDIWCKILITRFKIRISIALAQLTSQIYFLTNLKQNTISKIWIQQMFHYIKAIEIKSIYNQLTLIWNRLHYTFRFHISKSKFTIIV